ncbi:Lrp/AsnC family transcriptional regulator [Candidatus Woesearchaeota archaeon]|nr:Lrp/AsnC family transcriptional regulator [Candidatus Woesearchaeota archaeon]
MKEQDPISLTLKDRKIIAELYDDARKPYSEIAKNVKLSKEAVAYRVKRMLELGLFTGFNTIVDVRKLGWKVFFAYMRFKRIDIRKEEEILTQLKDHPHIAWQVKCIGNYDVIIKFFVHNHEEMSEIMRDIEDEYKEYVDTYMTEYIVEEQPVPLSFLFDTITPRVYPQSHAPRTTSITQQDLAILQIMAKNCRVSMIDISQQIGVARETVAYRVKRLEQEGVIIKYRPEVWSGTQKQGYNWFFVALRLGKMTHALEKTLFTYLWNHPHVTFYYKTSGLAEVQVEVRVKTTIEFNAFLMEIRSILKNVLKRHELLLILDEQKFTCLPACVVKRTVQ